MTKKVTLRFDDEVYQRLQTHANQENRPLSDYITMAALRFVESRESADKSEMVEIRSNVTLNRSLRRGLRDAKAGRGRFC